MSLQESSHDVVERPVEVHVAAAPEPVRLSVVIPCYNEEESLTELLRRVGAVCAASSAASYEILLVDDGSRDSTWSLIERATTTMPNVVGVRLARNYGHQLALSAGLSIVTGDRILVLDADLQDPPELLDEMMRIMDGGVDVVYGQRIKREGETVMKKLTAKWFYRLLDNMTDIEIPVDTGDFRLMTRRIVDTLNAMPESNRFIRGMVSWIGFSQVALRYERLERYAGETKYPFKKMLRLAFDAITGFSVKPLRIASYFGAVFGILGLVMMVYVAASWFNSNTIRGWTSLATIVLLMGSVQLVVLGLIGEYVGRLFMESKRRPIFLISDVVKNHTVIQSRQAGN